MTKDQKAPVLPDTAQFATVRNDITIPYYTDVLAFLDETLLERGGAEGLKIYDRIERDTHAYSVLQKRKHHLVARAWEVVPGGEDKIDIEAADFIRDQLDTIGFDQLTLDLLDATLKGFSVAEAIYLRDGRHVRVDRMVSIDQRRIVFDLDFKPRLLTITAPTKGEELDERKFVVHRFGAKGNNAYGLGLGSRLFWPVLFKREGVGAWLRFLERMAVPIPIGKYPIGTLPGQQRDLMAVLQGLNYTSAITVPLGTELDTFESKRSGTVDNEGWQRFWNGEMSKAVLGETLTTEMGANGARAASETHADMLDQLVDADADLLSGTLNAGLVTWLTAWNYPGARAPKVWRPRPSNELAEEELATRRAERRAKEVALLTDMRDLGYEVDDEPGYLEEVFERPVRPVAPRGPAQKKTLNSPSPTG